MNIIEAWKKAKVGQTIKEEYGYTWTKRSDYVTTDLYDALHYAMGSTCVSSESWEVVKEKKEVVGFVESVGMDHRCVVVFPCPIPVDAKITAEREE